MPTPVGFSSVIYIGALHQLILTSRITSCSCVVEEWPIVRSLSHHLVNARPDFRNVVPFRRDRRDSFAYVHESVRGIKLKQSSLSRANLPTMQGKQGTLITISWVKSAKDVLLVSRNLSKILLHFLEDLIREVRS
jgi:hypothetical protein